MLPARLPQGEQALPVASDQLGSGLPSPVSPLEEAGMHSGVAAAGSEDVEYEVGMWLWPKHSCSVPHLGCWLFCCSEEHALVLRVASPVVPETATPNAQPKPLRCRPCMEV